MASAKRKSLTPSWFRNVLGACEDLAETYEEEGKELSALQNGTNLGGPNLIRQSGLNARLKTLDECLAINLGTLLAIHQVPDERRADVVRRIKKIKAGDKTAESVAILLTAYKNAPSSEVAQ